MYWRREGSRSACVVGSMPVPGGESRGRIRRARRDEAERARRGDEDGSPAIQLSLSIYCKYYYSGLLWTRDKKSSIYTWCLARGSGYLPQLHLVYRHSCRGSFVLKLSCLLCLATLKFSGLAVRGAISAVTCGTGLLARWRQTANIIHVR